MDNKIFKFICSKAFIITIFLLSTLGIVIALFSQYSLGLKPCNLCIIQRIIIAFISVISFIFIFIKNRLINIIYIVLVFLSVGLGLFVSIKHIFLIFNNRQQQNFLTCGADLNFLFKNLPFYDFYKSLITGTNDCTLMQKLFFVPVPVWSLILFILILIIIISSLKI